jgi:hypothetical protein
LVYKVSRIDERYKYFPRLHDFALNALFMFRKASIYSALELITEAAQEASQATTVSSDVFIQMSERIPQKLKKRFTDVFEGKAGISFQQAVDLFDALRAPSLRMVAAVQERFEAFLPHRDLYMLPCTHRKHPEYIELGFDC